MSIKSQIERIEQNVSDTYDALEEVGADMPSTRNTANLAATARTVKPVFTITATEGNRVLTDVSATFAEMYEAHQAGKLLVLVASSPYTDAATLLQCEHVTADNIIFSTLSTIGGENGSFSANIFADDSNVYQWVEVGGGVDEETLNAAVESALTEAKASGEFDGSDGERGTGILNITTAPSSYTTATGGFTPVYRIDLSTVRTQSGVSSVFVGDQLRYSYYLYPVGYVDSSYVYLGTRVSLRGSTGASSEWYAGTGITGTSTTATIFSGSGISAATVGDMYLNTSTYNTYRCTTAGAASAAKWVYVCNIKGAPGTSVAVSKVTESSASGGTNVMTFSDGTTLNVKNGKDGENYVLTAADKNEIADGIATGLTLGVHTDGLIYIFKDGELIGSGIEMGVSGDVVGYVDSDNNIVLNGNLADGTYSVKYEMDGGKTVNIGNLVLDTNVYYTVKNTLTNCKNSNSATQVIEGNSYSATITANDGYELKTVTVTMGGTNVSVSGGKINIASVTGNIVITAVAEVVKTETNFAVYNSTNTSDWSIWINNARAGSDGTYRSDTYSNSYGTPAVSNYIEVQNGDIVEFTGMYSANKMSVVYNSSKQSLASAVVTSLTSYLKDISLDNNAYSGTFTIDNASVKYVRIGGYVGHSTHPVSEISIKIKRNGEYL